MSHVAVALSVPVDPNIDWRGDSMAWFGWLPVAFLVLVLALTLTALTRSFSKRRA